MSDPTVSSNGKLNALNKKIVEVKKKIQLSEGQRKANFEECDAKKRESTEKISRMKREVKELHVEFAKAKNNDEAAERAARLSRESSAYVKKRNLQEAISTLDEDNIRLRKKLDLVKYQNDKQQKRLSLLLQEYEELMNGNPRKNNLSKSSCLPIKKKITRLENQLHRVSVMQMEADTVRKKYRSVRASLKADASFYASCLNSLEESIREQENEIKRLHKVKTEAIELRDATKETLTKQEVDALHTTKERETIIQEYRKRVEDRKIELERLERMMFSTTNRLPRDGFDTGRSKTATDTGEAVKDVAQNEMEILEEAFAKLRNATGVSRTEDVLDRFLAQRATKEKLKKMQVTTEEEKMALEKKRQQLTAEIEMQKFSETKDTDQNAEKLEKLNKQIEEQIIRQKKAAEKIANIKENLQAVADKLSTFSDRLHEDNEIIIPGENIEAFSPIEILNKLNDKIIKFIEKAGGPEKYKEFVDQIMMDKIEAISLETGSEQTKPIQIDDQPLFPLFPTVTTPAVQAQPSEDEDEIPSRSFLKRQAQLLVDTKSRRKGFNIRR